MLKCYSIPFFKYVSCSYLRDISKQQFAIHGKRKELQSHFFVNKNQKVLKRQCQCFKIVKGKMVIYRHFHRLNFPNVSSFK